MSFSIRTLSILLLVIWVAGCALMRDEITNRRTYVFKEPIILGMDCDSFSTTQDVSGYPFFTQKIIYRGQLRDTINFGVNELSREPAYRDPDAGPVEIHIGKQTYCSEGYTAVKGCRNLYDIPKASIHNTIVYLFNPGPDIRYYRMWDGNVTTQVQMFLDGAWMRVDRYSAGCGTMNFLIALNPNEIVAIAVPVRSGDDLIKCRIARWDRTYSEEFLIQGNLDSLYFMDCSRW
jgi:hypothetical protein